MHELAVVSGIVTAAGVVLLVAAIGGPTAAPTQVVPRSFAACTIGLGLAGLCVVGSWWAFTL